MLRAVLLVLPLLTLAGGCKATTRDVETVKYCPGTPPTTVTADRDATYSIYDSEKLEWRRGEVEVRKGDTVGFRREPDGSLVALVGEQMIPLSDGRYALWATPKLTLLERFADKTREGGNKAAVTAHTIIFFPVAVMLMVVTGGAIAEL